MKSEKAEGQRAGAIWNGLPPFTQVPKERRKNANCALSLLWATSYTWLTLYFAKKKEKGELCTVTTVSYKLHLVDFVIALS